MARGMDEGMTLDVSPVHMNISPTDSAEGPERDNRFATLLALIGFGCFWAGAASVVAGGVLDAPLTTPSAAFLERFWLLVGFAGVNFLSYTAAVNRFAEARSQLVVRTIALAAVLVLVVGGLFAEGPLALPLVRCALWLVGGVGFGLALVSWGTLWTALDAERPDNRTSALAVAGSVVLAAGLGTFMLFAPRTVSLAAVAVLFAASLALQAYASRQVPVPERVDRETSQRRLKLFSRNLLTPLVAGASFGVALALNTLLLDAATAFCTLLGSVALAGAAVVAMVAARGGVPRFSLIERVSFPVFGGALLALPFSTGALRTALLVLLMADIAFYLVCHWSVLVALSYRHHVQTAFHYAQGLIAPVGSIALGWGAVGALVFAAGLSLDGAMLLACLSAAFLLMLDLAIVPYASNKTVEAIAGDGPEEPHDQAGRWRQRCQDTAAAYGLTPREQEVFALLAKGRNTEVISGQLFISAHTVKTHTSRIYRKLSINSQQELIDLVEEGRTVE